MRNKEITDTICIKSPECYDNYNIFNLIEIEKDAIKVLINLHKCKK